MSKIDDGGFAFPIPATEHNYAEFGMTIRDWFAGKALAGLLACQDTVGTNVDIARSVYALADAMIAERRKGGGE